MVDLTIIKQQVRQALSDLQEAAGLTNGHLFVVGCSTSEVIGQKIGTAGTEEVASSIYGEISDFQQKTGVRIAFQGCEHINRSLVVERETAGKYDLEIVSVVPVPSAGGQMASFAYRNFRDPVVVEFCKADAGIDIGDTLIGMHLKHVAVPVRSKVKQVGEAHITLAKTRPKLIGGNRAVYELITDNEKCDG